MYSLIKTLRFGGRVVAAPNGHFFFLGTLSLSTLLTLLQVQNTTFSVISTCITRVQVSSLHILFTLSRVFFA